jgi:hypothetical protein
MTHKWYTRTSFKVGLITGATLIFYFLIARFFQVNYLQGWRYGNILIVAAAIYYVLKQKTKEKKGLHYLSGLMTGMTTSIVPSVMSNAFLFIYLLLINPTYMEIMHHKPLGEFMSPARIAVVFFTEETSAALIVTLILMQVFKLRIGNNRAGTEGNQN